MCSAPAFAAIEDFGAAVSRLECATAKSEGESGFEIDGLRPACVVTPRSEEALARTLAEARNRSLAVSPVGGGRHMHLGNVPSRFDVVLSTVLLTATREHEPDDLTATVDAGVRMGDLAKMLAARGQWLPIDAPEDATVGGLVAANSFGPLRHAYGTLRDWVIGMRVAHSDGSVTKSGGRVVKNVAGYDMHKLHIGALGTLGVITQVTFKLATIPRASATLRASFTKVRDACAFVLASRDRRLPLVLAEMVSHEELDGIRWVAVVRAAGQDVAVERSLRELTALADEHGATSIRTTEDAVQQPVSTAMIRDSIVIRAGVLPTHIAEMIEDLGALQDNLAVTATVCAGVIRGTADLHGQAVRDFIERAARVVERRRGSLFMEAAPAELKRAMDVFGSPRADWEIMRRLKQEFDPTATLSPGRFVGRL